MRYIRTQFPVLHTFHATFRSNTGSDRLCASVIGANPFWKGLVSLIHSISNYRKQLSSSPTSLEARKPTTKAEGLALCRSDCLLLAQIFNPDGQLNDPSSACSTNVHLSVAPRKREKFVTLDPRKLSELIIHDFLDEQWRHGANLFRHTG